ncbi:MAG TPA: rhodanese-like domain-containing protein, partial [Verrucomicrobiae bacterium]|nr:rhodanese-like domain-containing protein [Verrucomicrobiae bacterium]
KPKAENRPTKNKQNNNHARQPCSVIKTRLRSLIQKRAETAQRGGHIPGAKSIPWSTAVGSDGTFKSADELSRIYVQDKGVDPKKDTIAYCRIGERSSHTWFVLKYLLAISNVKNYDGSWTEYGNLVSAPIEKG